MNTARSIRISCESPNLHLLLDITNKGGHDEVQISKGIVDR